MPVPYWVKDAIFYQIFPDRFANGDPAHLRTATLPWEAAPTLYGFQGGDLRGILGKLDYLLDLGVNALYLNPIFQSTSNHRYNTSDYYHIDNKLGTLHDLKALLDAAHANGLRIILDGVFNHTGRGFFAFNDLLENGEHSPYQDWYYIKRFPLRAYLPGDAEEYTAWWNFKSLPKLNFSSAEVRRYILDVARYWIDQGIDGWRLDVPNEIDDDDFWADFRRVVKTNNPDAYLVGEIWHGDPRWAGENTFDGLTNYPLREGLLNLLTAKNSVSQFVERMQKLLSQYARENVYAMFLMVGSHDTERVWTMLGGSLAKVKLAYGFLFAFPGAPVVYYGDEIGIAGGKDPACRHTFSWDETSWRFELRQWVQKLIALRKAYAVLRRGDVRQVWMDDPRGCFAFARSLGLESILITVNASSVRRQLRLPVSALGWPEGRIVHHLLGDEEWIISGKELTLTIPAWSVYWIA